MPLTEILNAPILAKPDRENTCPASERALYQGAGPVLIVDFAVRDYDVDRSRRIGGGCRGSGDTKRFIQPGPQVRARIGANCLKEVVSKPRVTLKDGVGHWHKGIRTGIQFQ